MCISPTTLQRPREEWQDTDQYTTRTRTVPCGKCYKCLGRRRNAWAFRLHHEMLNSDTACFITLTYGINKEEGFGEDPPLSFNGIYTLEKRHLQLFIKRLREVNRRHQKRKYGTLYKNQRTLKYYAAAEYGTNNKRPHYHIIMFNLHCDFIQRSFDLSKNIWKKGNADIAQSNIATINYVVGYVMKGSFEPETDDDDREPEFSIMSQKLGASYLSDKVYHYHLDRMDTSANHPSGFKIPLPRYYRDQIFSTEEKAELYELNQKIQSMNWEEFVNIDHDIKRQQIHHQIKKHQSDLKYKRTTL